VKNAFTLLLFSNKYLPTYSYSKRVTQHTQIETEMKGPAIEDMTVNMD